MADLSRAQFLAQLPPLARFDRENCLASVYDCGAHRRGRREDMSLSLIPSHALFVGTPRMKSGIGKGQTAAPNESTIERSHWKKRGKSKEEDIPLSPNERRRERGLMP